MNSWRQRISQIPIESLSAVYIVPRPADKRFGQLCQSPQTMCEQVQRGGGQYGRGYNNANNGYNDSWNSNARGGYRGRNSNYWGNSNRGKSHCCIPFSVCCFIEQSHLRLRGSSAILQTSQEITAAVLKTLLSSTAYFPWKCGSHTLHRASQRLHCITAKDKQKRPLQVEDIRVKVGGEAEDMTIQKTFSSTRFWEAILTLLLPSLLIPVVGRYIHWSKNTEFRLRPLAST